MAWCAEGSSTYAQRRTLFLKQKEHGEKELARLNQTLDMIKFKCWYYEQALRDGNEDRVSSMKPEDMPEEIRRAFENTQISGPALGRKEFSCSLSVSAGQLRQKLGSRRPVGVSRITLYRMLEKYQL